MGLDLHLGATEDDAARNRRGAGFDEVLHRQLFDRGLLRDGECQLLQRMSHYCEDAADSCEEVGVLASEAESLLDRVNPILAEQLRQIASVARQASRESLNLYAFSD